MASLKWSQVDLEGKSLRLPASNTKTYEERVLPIADELLQVLLKLRLKSESEYVFSTRPGKPLTRDLRRDLLADCKRAGIDTTGVCIHSFRYTFASRLFDLGYSVPEVQKLTGHRNSSVLLKIYSKALDERKRRAVNGLFEKKGRNAGTSAATEEKPVAVSA